MLVRGALWTVYVYFVAILCDECFVAASTSMCSAASSGLEVGKKSASPFPSTPSLPPLLFSFPLCPFPFPGSRPQIQLGNLGSAPQWSWWDIPVTNQYDILQKRSGSVFQAIQGSVSMAYLPTSSPKYDTWCHIADVDSKLWTDERRWACIWCAARVCLMHGICLLVCIMCTYKLCCNVAVNWSLARYFDQIIAESLLWYVVA